jgi:DNA-binding GntR family transcriptional regulator
VLIARRPLRDDVRDAVLDLLISSELEPGSRIREADLAPIREALLSLEMEGFVRADLARGFSVLPLSADEVRENYPILWTLELLALRSAPVELIDVAELRRLNAAIADANDPAESKALDEVWHRTLLAPSENRRLADMIERLKLVLRRYEHAYMRDRGRVTASVDHHAEIADAAEAGDAARVALRLEAHWRFGMDRLLDWLEA